MLTVGGTTAHQSCLHRDNSGDAPLGLGASICRSLWAGALAVLCCSAASAVEPHRGWPLPGAAEGGGHFSEANQITPANVRNLKVAWTHRSGDFREGDNFIGGLSGEAPLQSSWQATPILVEDHLYLCTPFNRILAIHAETGAERWSYAPDVDLENFPMPRCRGVTQWTDQRVPPTEPCHRVIIAPLMDARVVGLDAVTGQTCPFGDVAELDLSKGLGPYDAGFYMLNTPPAITGNTLITGGSIADNITTAVPSGVVRAYDLTTVSLIRDGGHRRRPALSAGHHQFLVLSLSRP